MPRGWTVRPAISADAPRMAAFDSCLAGSPREESDFARYCIDDSTTSSNASEHALLAEDEHQILGYLLYARVLDQAEIMNIIIEPEARGQGIGRRLLHIALESMRAAGAQRCQLDVRESNAAAIALYAGEGFEQDGRRSGYYPAGGGGREDALLMSRKL